MSEDKVFSRVVPFSTVSPLGKPRGRSLKPPLSKRENGGEDPLETQRRRDEFVASSDLVKAVEQRKDAADMLHNIKMELAKEAARLKFMQSESESRGDTDTSAISLRRIKTLREIVNIEASISRMGVNSIDLKGEKFQKIFVFFLQCIREAAVEILDPEQVDLLFNRIETRLEGWEERAQGL